MILLFSGGLDSFVAYHYYDRPPTVYFNLGTPYSVKELEVVRRLIPDTVIEHSIKLGDRQEGENAYIPYRNLHLALLANHYSDTIVIAGLKDDKVNDKNKEIFVDWSMMMTYMMGRPIEVISPFWDMTKEQVVKWFLNNGGTAKELLSTISCYSGSYEKECGKCGACFRRWCALSANGIDVPVFNNLDLMLTYLEKAREGIHYIPERNETIIREVGKVIKRLK